MPMDGPSTPRRCGRIGGRAAAVAVLSVAVLLGVACGDRPVPGGTRASTDEDRRGRHRDELRDLLGDRYHEPVPAATDEQIERGAKTYDVLCRSCHGRAGRGTGRSSRLIAIPPPDLSDPIRAAFFSDRAKLQIIAEGLEGTPMIGWKEMLGEPERLDVFQYVRTFLREGPATESP